MLQRLLGTALAAFLFSLSSTGSLIAQNCTSTVFPPLQTTQTTPPPPSDDSTFSLGSFRIAVAPAFQGKLAGYPGYNPFTTRLQSPNLFDFSTRIGKSNTYLDGTAFDANGIPVGSAPVGLPIPQNSILNVPAAFTGNLPSPQEVRTDIRKLEMIPFAGGAPAGGCPVVLDGVRVRAGSMSTQSPMGLPSLPNGAMPRCPGEVQSLNPPNGTGAGFPAQSFFNVLAEIELPAFGGFPRTVLFNTAPLVVSAGTPPNPPVTCFPPTVVYMHVDSTAVPVFVRGTNELFGWLVLAGHILGATCAQGGILQAALANAGELPLPTTPSLGQPNTPNATATWGGVNHAAAGSGPIDVSVTATTIAFQVSGLANRPWILGASPGPALTPGLPTPLGIVNLDLNLLVIWIDGVSFSTGSLLDLLANTGPAAQTNFGIPVCNPYMLSQNTFQVLIADPASLIGFTLTAASTLHLNCGRFEVLPHGDDTFIQISQGPFCPQTTFYDATYATLFSNSNGNVTFGSPDVSFNESQAGFDNGFPRIAGAWDDFVVGAPASTTYTETTSGWRMRWNSVPEFVNVGANTFEIAYDCSTGTITLSFGAMSLPDALVGITPGFGFGSPFTVYPSLRSNLWGGSFGGHSGFSLGSINALYGTGFDLANATVSFKPVNFGAGIANSYDAF